MVRSAKQEREKERSHSREWKMPAIQSLNQAELQQVIGLLWASVSPSTERVTKAGEMAQRLQSLIPKVLDSIPGTHTEGLTAIHNSSSRGSDIVF